MYNQRAAAPAVITVYPVAGRHIGDPSNKFAPIPAEGQRVQAFDPYFVRAIADGDLTTVAPSAPEQVVAVAAVAPAAAPSAPAPTVHAANS